MVLSVVTLISCVGYQWIANPQPDKIYEKCDASKSFPQMIRVPGFPGIWQVVENCDEYPREKTAIALRVFRDEWRKEFGNARQVDKGYRDIMITWSRRQTRHTGFTLTGEIFKHGYLRGMTLSPSMIYVFQDPYGRREHTRICESSLAHELVHATLWTDGEHGDPDHLGDKFEGWTIDHSAVIQRTNKTLCVLGI